MLVCLILDATLHTDFVTPFSAIQTPTLRQLRDAIISDRQQWVITRLQLLNHNFLNRVLVLACLFGRDEIVEASICSGADNWNNGLVAAAQGGHYELARRMFACGATRVEVAFRCACEHDDLLLVRLLWEEGRKLSEKRGLVSDEDLEAPHRNSGLQLAIQSHSLDTTRFFLECGARAEDALWFAVHYNAYEIVRLVLAIRPDVVDSSVQEALRGKGRIALLLLQRGARLDGAVSKQSDSYLMSLLLGEVPYL